MKIKTIMRMLEKERGAVAQRAQTLDTAIAAVADVAAVDVTDKWSGYEDSTKRRFSPAGRRAIARGQARRWARWRRAAKAKARAKVRV